MTKHDSRLYRHPLLPPHDPDSEVLPFLQLIFDSSMPCTDIECQQAWPSDPTERDGERTRLASPKGLPACMGL
jgi:hypothetical protein